MLTNPFQACFISINKKHWLFLSTWQWTISDDFRWSSSKNSYIPIAALLFATTQCAKNTCQLNATDHSDERHFFKLSGSGTFRLLVWRN